MPNAEDADLVVRLMEGYGLERLQAERVIEEILHSYGSTLEEWVRSRHIRLQRRGLRNDEIYRLLADEIPARRFAAAPLSIRQIRRLIYG